MNKQKEVQELSFLNPMTPANTIYMPEDHPEFVIGHPYATKEWKPGIKEYNQYGHSQRVEKYNSLDQDGKIEFWRQSISKCTLV